MQDVLVILGILAVSVGLYFLGEFIKKLKETDWMENFKK